MGNRSEKTIVEIFCHSIQGGFCDEIIAPLGVPFLGSRRAKSITCVRDGHRGSRNLSGKRVIGRGISQPDKIPVELIGSQ